ncbi:MAG: ABC transporter substrate-binding protein, partial [Dehalococcoidia bacterium]|nr:ABC transporter substrate-binding protein [Dehalococcoidia bacterium]
MFHRGSFWYRLAALLIVLVLLAPMLAACGDDDEETPTPAVTTPTVTTPAKTTSTVTTSDKPVKIGAVFAWSGYGAVASHMADAAITLVNYQVQQLGGIRVGNEIRPLQIVKYDMKSDVGGATQAATKAITEDGCVALTMGGLTGADGLALADVAKKYNVLYSHFMGDASLNTDYTNTLNAVLSQAANVQPVTSFALEVLQPKTVALIASESSMERSILDDIQKIFEAKGVKVVFRQHYALTTVDFSSLMTRVKYENPDLVMCYASLRQYQAMFKSMQELGGWGKMKFLGVSQSSGGNDVVQAAGAEGVYVSSYWNPDVQNSGTAYWLDSWKSYVAAHPDFGKSEGAIPPVNVLPFYQTLW